MEMQQFLENLAKMRIENMNPNQRKKKKDRKLKRNKRAAKVAKSKSEVDKESELYKNESR